MLKIGISEGLMNGYNLLEDTDFSDLLWSLRPPVTFYLIYLFKFGYLYIL